MFMASIPDFGPSVQAGLQEDAILFSPVPPATIYFPLHPAMVMSYLVVMAGGALGSAARMWLSLFCAVRFGETFPVGTFLVNALGCFAIGGFSALTGPDGMILTSPLTRQFVMIGVLGGFTTFSSFGLQTINLMTDGEWLYAALNAGLSVVVCLAFVWTGITLVSLLTHK